MLLFRLIAFQYLTEQYNSHVYTFFLYSCLHDAYLALLSYKVMMVIALFMCVTCNYATPSSCMQLVNTLDSL